jgi:hypothetical protein
LRPKINPGNAKSKGTLLPFGIVPSLACQRLTIFAILLAIMYHLAALYNDGLGVEKDPKIAAMLLYAAADRNFQPAIDAIQKNRIPRPEE